MIELEYFSKEMEKTALPVNQGIMFLGRLLKGLSKKPIIKPGLKEGGGLINKVLMYGMPTAAGVGAYKSSVKPPEGLLRASDYPQTRDPFAV